MAGYVYRGTTPLDPREIRPPSWAKTGSKPGTNKKPLAPFDPTLCGTMPGYRQHRRHGQWQCKECQECHNAYQRQYRAGRYPNGEC